MHVLSLQIVGQYLSLFGRLTSSGIYPTQNDKYAETHLILSFSALLLLVYVVACLYMLPTHIIWWAPALSSEHRLFIIPFRIHSMNTLTLKTPDFASNTILACHRGSGCTHLRVIYECPS